MRDSVSDLHRYMEEHAQESLQELARLCRQPSISAQGLGMHVCAGMLAELLRSHGLATQVVETAGYPVVLGEYERETEPCCSTTTMTCSLQIP